MILKPKYPNNIIIEKVTGVENWFKIIKPMKSPVSPLQLGENNRSV